MDFTLFSIILVCTAIYGGCIYVLCLPLKRILVNKGHLNRNLSKRINIIYACLIPLVATIIYYLHSNPLDSYYEKLFLKNSGIPLPENAEIINDYYSGYGFHSDYVACAIVSLDSAEYHELKTLVKNAPTLEPDSSRYGMMLTSASDGTFSYDESALEEIYVNKQKESFRIGFMRDQRTFVFEYIQN